MKDSMKLNGCKYMNPRTNAPQQFLIGITAPLSAAPWRTQIDFVKPTLGQ